MRYFTFYHLCIGIVSSLLFISSVHAASFDCEKAENKVERMICNQPELSSLDRSMSTLYFSIRENQIIPSENLKTRQKAFLNQRNACAREKNIAQCLEDRYADIIDEYQQIPRSIKTDDFDFNIDIKKTYIRFDIGNPEWPYLTELYMKASGCSEGAWCKSNGYLVVKDATTELTTQVIYLPRAYIVTEYSENKAKIGYNKEPHTNGLVSLINNEDGKKIIISCYQNRNSIKGNHFKLIDNKVYFLIDQSRCEQSNN